MTIANTAFMHDDPEVPTSRRRWKIVAVILAGVGAWVLLSGLLIRGCMMQHSRPIGHSDISLDIAPSGDRIIFNAAGAGTWDLYLLELQTMHVERLAETADYECDPCFSPDGQLVVFAAGQPGDRADHIFVRSLVDGDLRQLTRGDSNDMSPRFSPDGSKVVFVRDKSYNWGGLGSNWSGGGSIHVVDVDGSNERQLTSDDQYCYAPQYSSDGTRIDFFAADGRFSINVDGSELNTALPFSEFGHVSNDGSLVAFTRGRYARDQEVIVANSNGTDQRQVTNSAFGSIKPVFTPKNDALFFFREDWPDGPMGMPKYSLWTVGIDGSNARMIAGSDLFDSPLTWRP